MTGIHELLRSSTIAQARGYSGEEIVVRGHSLPSEYWHLVRASNGFETSSGFFRFFSVGMTASRNSVEWVSAYGRLLDAFVSVAEDVFGDLYGYAFDGGAHALTKLYCEGGEREACEPDDVVEFLRRRVFPDPAAAFDSGLAERALLAGLSPETDEHLAFALPLVAGGTRSLENLTVEPASLHLGVLGQLSLANSEVPGGTPIRGFYANEEHSIFASSGDCPVCAGSGAALLLIRDLDEQPVFFCPLCACSWDTPPHAVDEIVSLRERAPGGVRLPTVREVEGLRTQFQGLTEVERSDWESLLPEYVRVRGKLDRQKRGPERIARVPSLNAVLAPRYFGGGIT